MLQSRTPITDAEFEHHFKSSKPMISNAESQPRVMSVAIMGEWLRERQSVTEEEFCKQFTKAERDRFEDDARDYAIRRSGNTH